MEKLSNKTLQEWEADAKDILTINPLTGADLDMRKCAKRILELIKYINETPVLGQ